VLLNYPAVGGGKMCDADDEDDLEYERIVIYPLDYDRNKRRKLRQLLKELGIRYEYEYY